MANRAMAAVKQGQLGNALILAPRSPTDVLGIPRVLCFGCMEERWQVS